LRDIGHPDAAYKSQPLALSPDGRSLALVLNRADPGSNSYCRALVMVSLSGKVRALDQGGDLITAMGTFGGLLTTSGMPETPAPVWSPDGRWIAYLRRDHGVTQLWRVHTEGGAEREEPARPVTQSPVDIETFTWSPSGNRLIYAATPALVEAEQAIDREGRQGWLGDARIIPNYRARPMVSALLPKEVFTVDMENGSVGIASPADRRLLAASADNGLSARSSTGFHAWTEHVSGNPLSPLRLLVEDMAGKRIACTAPDCSGRLEGMWWSPDGHSLVILRREGWNGGQMGLLRWVPGAPAFHRILLTDDVLMGCLPRGEALVCTSENAVTPRRVVEVDLRRGEQRTVYDPNPEFRNLRLGRVTRLTWTNDIGLPAWGDLVLPPDYTPGTRLPMVITQYRSQGFLRGGTGDEYPIHALAARGFAVLSLERPPLYGSNNPEFHTRDEIRAAGIEHWNERRSLLSSLVTGVKAVLSRASSIRRGSASPA
jgi:dipeptidyl aminopeptidase/acylaminoacyl peptidase